MCVTAYNRHTPWSSLTANIAHLIDGDINFGNIETVVSNVPLSLSMEKKFKFQSHPNSIVHLARLGFNLFSLANNHMADYGYVGLESTYAWMNEISKVYPVYHHGLGVNQELMRPTLLKIKGITVAFMAIGIDGFGLQNFPATSRRVALDESQK